MSEEPMTRKQVEDLLELMALKFSNVVTEKLDEHGDKQRLEQRLARESTFEQGTGLRIDRLSGNQRIRQYPLLYFGE